MQSNKSETNKKDICVSPVLNCSSLKGIRNKKRKIKRNVVINSPDLSTLKKHRRKMRIDVDSSINGLNLHYINNSKGNLENHIECTFTKNDKSIMVKKERNISLIETKIPYTLANVNNQHSPYNIVDVKDGKILKSPVLNFTRAKRNLFLVGTETSSLNKKSVRKKLFTNFNEQHGVISANTKMYSPVKEMSFSVLGSNHNGIVEDENKIGDIQTTNNDQSTVNSPCLKKKSNHSLESSDQFNKSERDLCKKKCYFNKTKFNILKTIPLSPEIKSSQNLLDKSINVNGVKSLVNKYSVNSISLNENYLNDSSEKDFTISEFPSPSNSKNSGEQTKSGYKIRKTANFEKVWSISKNYFENNFESLRHEEGMHISDHSSPENELLSNKSILSTNMLDERHLEMSEQFVNCGNKIDIKIYNTTEQSTCKQIYKNNSFRRIFRRKRYNNLNVTPALEIITQHDMEFARKLPKRSDQATSNNSQQTSIESCKVLPSNVNLVNPKFREKKCYNFLNVTNDICHDLSTKLSAIENCNKVESVSKDFDNGDSICQSIEDENIQSDALVINNDSQIIANNTISCSQVSSEFVIETISSPSVGTTNKTIDEIQFSDASSIDKEYNTTPNKEVKCPVNWSDNLDSASKTNKRKYPENSLVGRMITIKNRYESDIRLRQHMLSNGDYTQVKLTVFLVKSVWKEYARTIILCCPYNEQSSSDLKTSDSNRVMCDNVHVLVDSTNLPTQKITNGTLIKIHPPWNVLLVPEDDMTLVFGATCIEVVPQKSVETQQLKTNPSSNVNTIVTNFNCLCLQDLVEDAECPFRLNDQLTVSLCPRPQCDQRDVDGMQHKKISRFYFHKQYEGTLGNFRAFHLLNPDAYITSTILTTYDSRNKEQCGNVCAVIRDEMEEIGVVILCTETDILKWKNEIYNSNGEERDSSFKITALNISHSNPIKDCQILERCQITCRINQQHVYYFTPASDWWTIRKLESTI